MTRRLELLIGTEQELKLRRHFIHDPEQDLLIGLGMESAEETDWNRRSANHLDAHYEGTPITLITGTPHNQDLIYDQSHYHLTTPTAEETAQLQETYNGRRQE